MQVFKFGGASVKDADSVKNVLRIIQQHGKMPLVVVVSAMDKTTNHLEEVLNAHLDGRPTDHLLTKVRNQHVELAKTLFGNRSGAVVDAISNILVEVEWALSDPEGLDGHFQYDQIVSAGEMLSTRIISAYLKFKGLENAWVDARDLIRTDNSYRQAKVNWKESEKLTTATMRRVLGEAKVVVTQGFIGGTSENFTTTLGREGSDFTAAILAACLKAENVTIWKDVPGVLNADPKFFADTVLIPNMSYHDAMELAYFGTSVIHPKTIKPLQNAGIPLFVRSFMEPEKMGTLISDDGDAQQEASYIVKPDQVLVSISPKDHSFIVEDHLKDIFSVLHELRIHSNVMQNSATSFSVCADANKVGIAELRKRLDADFHIRCNEGCALITIRYFNDALINSLVSDREILLEQRTRTSAQLVVQ